ncbi:alpha/beta-hydrolase [Neoconidiobolus thromboides FSU 785]|nr:alpha/beta-hydrolase [Neoconidiobolus thromboides FSU 785]
MNLTVNAEDNEITKSERTLIISKIKKTTEEESKDYVLFASSVYCPKEQIINWSCSRCRLRSDITQAMVFEHKNTESRAFITVDHKNRNVIIAFRGSANLKNWLQNVKILKSELLPDNPEVQVHLGFKQCMGALRPNYLPVISNLLKTYPNYHLIVTGHSLGGAVASLAAADLYFTLKLPSERVKLFTYGEPRVGNNEFAKWYDLLPYYSSRVVNKNDIVPRLPPRLLGFSHRNNEIWLTKSGSQQCSSLALEDSKCSLSVNSFLSVTDHMKYWDTQMGHKC